MLTRKHVIDVLTKKCTTHPDLKYTAKEIVTFIKETDDGHLDFEKKDVNRFLYDLALDGIVQRIDGIPPYWRLLTEKIQKEEEEKQKVKKQDVLTYVLVDCDNRPHCFKNASQYAKPDSCHVIGFAGVNYNFWKPVKEDNQSCYLVQAHELLKDIAEIEMCFKACEICQQHQDNNNNIEIILVSGDKCINTIASVISKKYKKNVKVKVYNTYWDDLRHELE